MKTTLVATFALISGSLFLVPFSFAQDDRWDAVQQLTAGEKIKVVLRDGHSRQGEFRSASRLAVILGTEESIPRENIRQVLVKGPGHRGRHALIGAAIGAGAGLGVGAGLDGSQKGSLFPNLGKEIFTPAGAIVGAALGAALPASWRQIY